MMKIIKKLLQFLYEDIKSDIVAIKRLVKGDFDSTKMKKHFSKVIKGMPDALRTYWIFFIVILFAVVVGWLLSAKYYENSCNEFVQEIIIPQCEAGVFGESSGIGGLGSSLGIVNNSAFG